MVGITRNSLVFEGISNLRLTGVFGWNHINRGNNDLGDNNYAANLFGLFSEADTAWDNTASLDFVYVEDDRDGNAWYAGAASTQRFGRLNTTFRVTGSIPEGDETPTVGRGVLLLSQLSSTPSGSDSIAYFNIFWNIRPVHISCAEPGPGRAFTEPRHPVWSGGNGPLRSAPRAAD